LFIFCPVGFGSPDTGLGPTSSRHFLRHASSDITMDIYTHAQDEAKRKALEKFEARLVQ
jgi:hypothetical protein